MFQATMKQSLDSDEEEELGTLQKTLRGDVFIDRTYKAAFQPKCCSPQRCNFENDTTESKLCDVNSLFTLQVTP